MYAHIETDRGEVKFLSPLPINTIRYVLNASEHEKNKKGREIKRETKREEERGGRERLPGKLHSAFEYHIFYCKRHQNDNGYIFSYQDSTLLTRQPG
jgi:hypothetical protein